VRILADRHDLAVLRRRGAQRAQLLEQLVDARAARDLDVLGARALGLRGLEADPAGFTQDSRSRRISVGRWRERSMSSRKIWPRAGSASNIFQ
jgi:hypothetical protein